MYPRHRLAAHEGDDQLLSITEAAQLGIASYSTLRNWIRSGRLPATRIGERIVRIRRSDLEALREPAARAAVTMPTPDDELDDAVRRVVADAPALSDRQIRELSSIFGRAAA